VCLYRLRAGGPSTACCPDHPIPGDTCTHRRCGVNDKIAASILVRLLAKGLLVGVWVPPQEIRELRGLVAQRKKMTGLATQAKNRLHAVLQRHHWLPPEGNPFHTCTSTQVQVCVAEEVVADITHGTAGKSECAE
jgi:hypothetical protein